MKKRRSLFGAIVLATMLLPVFGIAFGLQAATGDSVDTSKQPAFPPTPPAKDTSARDEVAGLFARRCSGCHSVGGGKLTGPDLIGAAAWAPAEIQQKIKAMEKHVGPLTDNEIGSLTALLKDMQAKARIEKAGALLLASMLKSLAPPSAELGSKLFTGELALRNGGPNCIGCHSVDRWGGALGPDLTSVGQRMGPNALVSAILNSDYKVMRAIYRKTPVTEQEAIHLSKYFETIKDAKAAEKRKMSGYIGFAGLGGALIFLGFLPSMAFRRYRDARAKLRALVRQRM